MALAALCAATTAPAQPGPELPHAIAGGFALPNGWRITPAGEKLADIGDLVLKLVVAPDRKAVVAVNSGYLPHGLTVLDPATGRVVQRITLKSTWLGLAWSPDGRELYVSGGNAGGSRTTPTAAPIYVFSYRAGRLSEAPVARFDETVPLNKIWWSGVARHPTRPLLYAANRGTGPEATNVVVFDARTRKLVTRIPVDISPYELVFSKDGRRLFVSNWSSNTVSVIDTAANRVIATIKVGANPNDMALSADGRLFVACSNDNTVHVIDTRTLKVVERLSTTLTPLSPEGSTPNALALDGARRLLFVANADNNDVAVIDIRNPTRSEVVGFIPTGWYPSALTLAGGALYVGSTKGDAGHADLKGPGSPLASSPGGDETIKTLQTSSLARVPLADLPRRLPGWTKQVYANTPYNDALLRAARPWTQASIVPSAVGAGSPIRHVIYIIKENRTYDQVLGDLPRTNGDPRLTIFGRRVTPNQHAMAEQFVTLDNLYADGDVSVDGHSWSNAAYATDFNEKWWPPTYGDHSDSQPAAAYIPAAGHLWDLAKAHGLTWRSYGEYAARVSRGGGMDAVPGITGLVGHVSKAYMAANGRDTDNARVFISEFDQYEADFDSPDPEKQLPNFIVMALPEDHTAGTRPGAFTPTAMVASNDLALGQIVERVTHSKYWPTTAIFIIEDDAQDGPDHVDARRTTGFVISPYIRRGTVDSTLYTTSSFVRTIELLLGLPPMSQYDAAATPIYAAFGTTPDLAPFTALPAQVDLQAKNTATAFGAAASARMDFSDNDRAPMHELNEIIWKSVMGADSPMPPPVHRYRALVDVSAP